MNKLNLGIIGHGFVGKAVDHGFNDLYSNINKYIVDPNYDTTVSGMFETFIPDVVFIAVPTPMSSDGSINSTIIEKVFHELAESGHNPLAVIKSTITPDVIQKIKNIYGRVIYNPEFLTERNANLDFINPSMLIIGGDSKADMLYLKHIYDTYTACVKCPVYYVDMEAASMIKYTLNCFMASKVLFFNQIKDIYENCGTNTDWNAFINVVASDPRMGKTHMAVPGPDGRYGFGGACFSKDSAALIKYSEELNKPFTTLKEVVKSNQLIRNQYDELDPREKEQNVSFTAF